MAMHGIYEQTSGGAGVMVSFGGVLCTHRYGSKLFKKRILAQFRKISPSCMHICL